MAVSRDVLALTGESLTTRWNREAPLGTPVVLTYSFPQKQNDYDQGDKPAYTGFSEAHAAHITKALKTWEAAAGVTFVRVPNKIGGEIQFSMFDMTGYRNAVGQQVSGWGYYPTYTLDRIDGKWQYANELGTISGDIFMNASFYAGSASSIAPGIRGYMIVLHEIGHALGFKHPFEGTPTIDPAHDNGSYTVMSYDVAPTTTALGSVDIEAMQLVYGNTGIAASWNARQKAVVHQGADTGQWHLGTNLADIVHGNGGNDTIRTKGGRDRIFDGPGGDRVDAGWGNDFVVAGKGMDHFQGGDGFDTLTYREMTTGVGLNMATGKLWGAAAGDWFKGFELIAGSQHDDWMGGDHRANTLQGNAGKDRLQGAGGTDKLLGGKGDDRLFGQLGNDRLSGDKGFDRLFGGKGEDRLLGGPGPDQLTGGPHADTFIFDRTSGKDRILDFKDNVDTIDLTGMDIPSVLIALTKARQVGDDVVFTFTTTLKLTIEDVTLAEISDDIQV